MNNPSLRRQAAYAAILVAFLSPLSFSAHAAPAAKTDPSATAAARKERAERAAFQAKQRALAEDKGIAVDSQAQASSPILDLPQEEADAPGAVKQ
jgi:hypothetical protein